MLKGYFEKLYKGDREAFFASLNESLEKGKRRFVVTANPETLMMGEKYPEFDALLLSRASEIVPDGIGVVRGAEKLGYSMQGRVCGVEIAQHLLFLASEKGLRVWLYGASEETIAALREKIGREYQGLVLCGAKNGYEFDDDEVFREILQDKPDIVLVALGIPRQEKLIGRHLDKFEKGVFVGVGGSFDVLGGMLRRAPKIFVNLNLEWLWRILREPRRLRRFFQSNVKYLAKIRALSKK